MKKICRKLGFFGILLGVMLLAAGIASEATTVKTQAAVNGLQTIGGRTYYYENGKKVTGLKKINGKWYFFNTSGVMQKGYWQTAKLASGKLYKRYFDKTTGIMCTGLQKIDGTWYYFSTSSGLAQTGFIKFPLGTRYFFYSTGGMARGWMKNSQGQKWYFNSSGYMSTGWSTTTESGKSVKRYFNPSTGVMSKGLTKIDGKWYFFNESTGAAYAGFYKKAATNVRYFFYSSYQMAVGWMKTSSGQKYYFDQYGLMAMGLKKIDGSWYYFNSSGVAQSGWVNVNGYQRYFNPSTYKMTTGNATINGVSYTFSSSGIVQSKSLTTAPTSEKTIKNYLAGALQPVGKALYVWGGGWNDSTRKGLSSTMTAFYNSQSSSYNYQNYRDLLPATRAKGFDCSGFVGWAAYQVMQSKSGVGSGYTCVSGEVGALYKGYGWGSILTQSSLSSSGYKIYPGDIGYDDGHVWIYLGQCSDKSAVIVHSTPNAGVQISGTPTPSGSYSSQAIALAKKYMSKYNGYTKYTYNTSSGNYIRRGSLFRWNSSTLSDPEGLKNKTADQILAILFNS